MSAIFDSYAQTTRGQGMHTARAVIVNEIDAEIERMEEAAADDLARHMRLPEWGYWARCDDSGLGYSKPVLVFEAKGWWATEELKSRIPRISDDQALLIDGAIGVLGHPYREAIERVYLQLQSYRSLSRYWQRQHMVAVGKLSMILPH